MAIQDAAEAQGYGKVLQMLGQALVRLGEEAERKESAEVVSASTLPSLSFSMGKACLESYPSSIEESASEVIVPKCIQEGVPLGSYITKTRVWGPCMKSMVTAHNTQQ